MMQRWMAAGLGLVALAACGGPGGDGPQRFALPPGPSVGDVVAAADGTLWFARGYAVGRMTPDGTLSEVSPQTVGIVADVAAAASGAVWYSQPGLIGRIDSDGTITEFALADSPQSAPQGLEVAADGTVWFTIGRYVDDNIYQGAIGRIGANGAVTTVALPEVGVTPQDLAAAVDGGVWFGACRWNVASQACEQAAMGRMSADGAMVMTPFALATTDARDLAFGPDGALWFVDRAGATLNRYDLASGAVAASPLPTGSLPTDLAALPEGGWVAAGIGVFITAESGDSVALAGLESVVAQGVVIVGDQLWLTETTPEGGFLTRAALP